jgi:phospholipase C
MRGRALLPWLVCAGALTLACGVDTSPRAGAAAGASSRGALRDGAGVAGSGSRRVGVGLNSGAECPSPLPEDELDEDHSAERAACTFSAGASVDETLGFMPTRRARIPLSHVIVMMKENHSYDAYFGRLYEHGQPDSEPLPEDFVNLDAKGVPVTPFHATSTCPRDQNHQWHAMRVQVDNGKMDGFVRSAAADGRDDGHQVMGWFDDSDLPFYYFLANTFAIADHNYPSVRSGTFPNRDYLLLGTSDGVRSTGGHPSASLPTLFTLLDARGISWAVYTSNGNPPFEGTLGWPVAHNGVSDIDEFFARLADGNLPQVVFVDSAETIEDEHPPANIQSGEAWTYNLYLMARRSPLWRSLAIFLTYDEAGGYFDHVPPPNDACIARPQDKDFFELGVRVPLIAISRFARGHYVSHLRHEHTSILRFIELLFDLPALTARDANSDALLDMFDFACPNDATLEPPYPGTGGCK